MKRVSYLFCLSCALPVSLLVQRKRERTSEVGQRSSPPAPLCPFPTCCPFLSGRPLHPQCQPNRILESQSRRQWRQNTRMKQRDESPSEMFSVDKNPSFVHVPSAVVFVERHHLRSTLSFPVESPYRHFNFCFFWGWGGGGGVFQ